MSQTSFDVPVSPAYSKHSEDGTPCGGERSSAMTWLQAAEQVLKEEGPDMHIRELTSRIMELGMVKSSCTTSLETLLYRQTSNSNAISKFVRVSGKHGWFGLREDYIIEPLTPVTFALKVVPHESVGVAAISVECDEEQNELDTIEKQKPVDSLSMISSVLGEVNNEDYEFEPRVFYTSRQRKRSYLSSDDSLSSSSDDELNEQGQFSKRSRISSDEESITDDSVYRKKYNFVKKVAKTIIFENAALSDQLSLINDRIARLEPERKFLLEKLIHFERAARLSNRFSSVKPPLNVSTTSTPILSNSEAIIKETKAILKSREKKPNQWKRKQIPRPTVIQQKSHSQKPPPVVNSKEKEVDVVIDAVVKAEVARKPLLMSDSSLSSDQSDSEGDRRISLIDQTPSPVVKSGKKKVSTLKKTAHDNDDEEDGQLELAMRCGKVRRLHPISLSNDGSPVFPITIGGLKVFNLGKIIFDRPAYHSERYILPVDFESCRTYPSMIDPSRKSTYTCRILDGGEQPIFEMVADDDQDNPIRAASSTACQTIVLRNINKARDKQATNSGSGPEFFGYSNPTILNLLQKMPYAKNCSKYKFVRFAEPQRRSKKLTKSLTVPISKHSQKHVKSSSKVAGSRKRKMPSNSLFGVNSESSMKPIMTKVAMEDDSGLAIAPVFGGMDTVSYSSSDEGSLSSECDLVIDG